MAFISPKNVFLRCCGAHGRALVIIDAGIATEDNLAEIRRRGYDYLCVSRTRLADYELADDMRSVTVMDARRQPITLREIESTNRQLKTDLNLRPIYHQKDDRSDAHLFLGVLAYWVVNTVRYKMKLVNEERERVANRDKKPGERKVHYPTPYWTEIVRVMSTLKAITTEGTNALGEKVNMRICNYPNKKAEYIYDILKYKKMPFRKIKICSTQ